MKEEWKAIKGYEGIYEVSSKGRVRSLDRYTEGRRGLLRGHIVIAIKQKKTGYMRICLSKDKIKKYYSVHRLVAEAFIPNPNNYPCVNHLNEIRSCNYTNNLQWCTHKQNIHYGNCRKHISEALLKRDSRPIMQIDMNNNLVCIFRNAREAINKGFSRSNLYKCLKGRTYTYLGYKWEYA